jgi:hypothetical protein
MRQTAEGPEFIKGEIRALVNQLGHELELATTRETEDLISRARESARELAMANKGYEEVLVAIFPDQPNAQTILARIIDRDLAEAGLPNPSYRARRQARLASKQESPGSLTARDKTRPISMLDPEKLRGFEE